MAPRRNLRAVGPNDKPPAKSRPKTVTEAADKGSTRELLAAMRARLATAVEDPNTPARDLAALTNRLMQVVREIEAMDARSLEDGDVSAEVTDGEFDASAV